MANVYTGVFDRWHEAYERGRPGWPAAVVHLVRVPPSASVLELGAGTGKLTRLLVSAFADVAAVEPDKGMRRLLSANCPDADVLVGSAEAIPCADDSADAVFAAESFHWFDAQRALPEIARVLRPRGALVLMWNLPAGPIVPSIEPVERLLTALGPDASELQYESLDLNPRRYSSGEWQLPFAGAPFEELREERLSNPQTLDREAMVAFLLSMGWISELPDAERRALVGRVTALLDAAEYRRPWETRVHWTRLQATSG